MSTRRKRAAIALAAVAVAALVWAATPFLETVAFLMDIAGRDDALRRVLPFDRAPVSTSAITIPTRHGDVAARLFRPAARAGHTVLVIPGVHAGGVNEPRLVTFASRLAGTGLTVVAVPLPELREFHITGQSTDMIEDAVRWAASDRALAPAGRVALVGVSFGGGLVLAAAGREGLSDRIDGVVSLGGYGDLARVMHFLCTGVSVDGSVRRPHDYGLAVVALEASRRLVPPDEVAAFEAGVRTYLAASFDESPDGRDASRLVAEARRQAAALAEPGRTLLGQVIDRDVTDLGRVIDPFVDELAADPSLSPERSRATRVPVFLLHGREDNVIPPAETPHLAGYLREQGNTQVHWLLTPFLSHVGIDSGGPLEAWRFVRFWQASRAAMD